MMVCIEGTLIKKNWLVKQNASFLFSFEKEKINMTYSKFSLPSSKIFEQSALISEKLRTLTIILQSWTIQKTRMYFDTTAHVGK